MSCAPPRRHEIDAVPILSRFGLTRPDEHPLPFGEHLAAHVRLGDFTTAAPGWGRSVQVFATVPANALLFAYAAFDPPEEGAWITALAASSGGGASAPRIFTANQVAEPALAAAGSVSIVCRFDDREPQPAIRARTGHAGGGSYGEVLIAVYPRPIWWARTALVIAAGNINESLDVNLSWELPFSGVRRA